MKLLEYDYLVLEDGTKYQLADGRSRFILSSQGFGMAPREINTQRGPYQHGESFVSRYLVPRTLQYTIRQNYPNRDYYNKGIDNLAYAVDNTITLVRVFPDGSKRAIDVQPLEGPTLDPSDGWDRFSIHDVLRFYAPDPTFYNPDKSRLVLAPGIGSLVFPATFTTIGREAPDYIDCRFYTGIAFYEVNLSGDAVSYGTWETYPIIYIAGSIENPEISDGNGHVIRLNCTIPLSVVVAIDLRYGYKTITAGDGTNYMQYLDSNSNLVEFKLLPRKNSILVSGTGLSSGTSVTVDWYDRYLSVGQC